MLIWRSGISRVKIEPVKDDYGEGIFVVIVVRKPRLLLKSISNKWVLQAPDNLKTLRCINNHALIIKRRKCYE